MSNFIGIVQLKLHSSAAFFFTNIVRNQSFAFLPMTVKNFFRVLFCISLIMCEIEHLVMFEYFVVPLNCQYPLPVFTLGGRSFCLISELITFSCIRD